MQQVPIQIQSNPSRIAFRHASWTLANPAFALVRSTSATSAKRTSSSSQATEWHMRWIGNKFLSSQILGVKKSHGV